MKIATEVVEVLRRCRIDGQTVFICDTAGRAYGEPGAIPLERKLYESTNKVLELIGGKWNRKSKGHVFEDDPTDRLENAIVTEDVTDTRKLFQFFETPIDIARRMVRIAEITPHSRVLEPSAGCGRILCEVGPGADKVACELDPVNIKALVMRGFSGLRIEHGDFLECLPTHNMSDPNAKGLGMFDAVVMNPPFTKGQDIAHITHAIRFVKPGGRLVAICSNGPRQRAKLKPIVEEHGGAWFELPRETFKESGTCVSTVLLSMTL